MAKKQIEEVKNEEVTPVIYESQEVAVLSEVPDFLKKAQAEDAGLGNENITMEDLIVPRLEIAQALSACMKKHNAEYIPGIQEGDMYNTVTRENYGREVNVVFANYHVDYVLWVDRKFKVGSGFKGSFRTYEEAVAARNVLPEKEHTAIVNTPAHTGLIITKSGPQPIMICMPVSKNKANRLINSTIANRKGARFSAIYTLKSVLEKKGDDEYFNYDISRQPVGYPSEGLYGEAKKYYELSASNQISTNQVNIEDAELQDASQEF